jgi:hypothetical protein
LERVGRRNVQTREPHAGAGLAALRQRIGEDVQLRQRCVESQSKHGETPLYLRGRRLAALGALQPAQEFEYSSSHSPAAPYQVSFDCGLRFDWNCGGRHHCLLQREWLNASESGQECPRLLFQHGCGNRWSCHRCARVCEHGNWHSLDSNSMQDDCAAATNPRSPVLATAAMLPSTRVSVVAQ